MSANYVKKNLIDNSAIVASFNSEPVELDGCDVGTIQVTHGSAAATAKTFDSGTSDVDTATFANKAGTTAGDYLVVFAQDGLSYAIAADITGSDPVPSGAIYTAIPSARKAKVNLSATTTAASVAAAFEIAFNALAGFTAKVTTDDTAANGTMLFTQVVRGVTSASSVHNANDSGAGSIAVAQTTPGVASEVDVAANSVAIPSHGYVTGVVGRLTTTGTLPAGLALATDYFVIYVDANTIKFATSYANAVLGTAVDITDQGSQGAVNTYTPTTKAGSLQPQVSNVADPASTDWISQGSAISISGAGATTSVEYAREKLAYTWFRVAYTHTAGQFSLVVIGNFKV